MGWGKFDELTFDSEQWPMSSHSLRYALEFPFNKYDKILTFNDRWNFGPNIVDGG